jgi:hypothetical protein
MEEAIPQTNMEPKRFPKPIFIILALILIGEAVFAFKTLTQPTPAPLPKAEAVSTIAKVSLTSLQSEYKVGDSVPVKIAVDTGGHKITGADVVLHFDSNLLMATDSASITKGSLKEYPNISVDPKLSTITISGITSLNGSFSGTFTLATVNFKAKAVGATALNLVFDPGSTTDTNLTEAVTSKDILESVQNVSLIIR